MYETFPECTPGGVRYVMSVVVTSRDRTYFLEEFYDTLEEAQRAAARHDGRAEISIRPRDP